MERNGNRTYGKNVGLFNYLIQLFYQLSTVYSAALLLLRVLRKTGSKYIIGGMICGQRQADR